MKNIIFVNMIVLTKPICIIMKAFNLLAAIYDSPEDKTALATFFLLHPLGGRNLPDGRGVPHHVGGVQEVYAGRSTRTRR